MSTVLFSIAGLAIIIGFACLLAIKPGSIGKVKRRIARNRQARMEMGSNEEIRFPVAIDIGFGQAGFPSKPKNNNDARLTNSSI